MKDIVFKKEGGIAELEKDNADGKHNKTIEELENVIKGIKLCSQEMPSLSPNKKER